MTALSGTQPQRGVRYRFTLLDHDDATARYEVRVQTAAREHTTHVALTATSAALDGAADGLDEAHVTQLLALAKTIARRGDDMPWPRRVERWRSPGVR